MPNPGDTFELLATSWWVMPKGSTFQLVKKLPAVGSIDMWDAVVLMGAKAGQTVTVYIDGNFGTDTKPLKYGPPGWQPGTVTAPPNTQPNAVMWPAVPAKGMRYRVIKTLLGSVLSVGDVLVLTTPHYIGGVVVPGNHTGWDTVRESDGLDTGWWENTTLTGQVTTGYIEFIPGTVTVGTQSATAPVAPAKPKAVCKCDIKELAWGKGHDRECPERKLKAA